MTPATVTTRTAAVLVACGLLLAGCGDDEPAPPGSLAHTERPAGPTDLASRAELAARAAAAQDRTEISSYAWSVPDRPERTVVVVRATDRSWRVDVPAVALDGAADISVVSAGDELFHCALTGCVAVAQLTPDIDPRVQHVFTSWPRVLTDRRAAISVAATPPPEGLEAADTACFHVQPSAASLLAPLDAGVYCYTADGTLTGADLELGRLRLLRTDTAPARVDLPGPVVAGEPLPLIAPDRSDSSPSPAPAGDG